MRLNPDCVRDLLLCAEGLTDGRNPVIFQAVFEPLEAKYQEDELLYHMRQCNDSGFFIGYKTYMNGLGTFKDVSPKAHEFLANIRQETVWNKAKSVAAQVGSTSLNALTDIAAKVISNLVQNHL